VPARGVTAQRAADHVSRLEPVGQSASDSWCMRSSACVRALQGSGYRDACRKGTHTIACSGCHAFLDPARSARVPMLLVEYLLHYSRALWQSTTSEEMISRA